MLFARHRRLVLDELLRFRPTLIHVTGPSHVGILGAWAAHTLHVPLVASWHTNVHEYAGRRLAQNLAWLPGGIGQRCGGAAEALVLRATMLFYRLARRTLAPNPELVALSRGLHGAAVRADETGRRHRDLSSIAEKPQ